MNENTMKLIAVLCIVAGLVCLLFLPVISAVFVGIGINGIQLFQFTMWMLLPVIAALLMVVCCFAVQNSIVSAVIVAIGSFVPLVTAEVIKSEGTGIISELMGGGVSDGIVFGTANMLLRPGLGTILFLLLGLVAAVLVFFSDRVSSFKATHHTSGLEADDNDW